MIFDFAKSTLKFKYDDMEISLNEAGERDRLVRLLGSGVKKLINQKQQIVEVNFSDGSRSEEY